MTHKGICCLGVGVARNCSDKIRLGEFVLVGPFYYYLSIKLRAARLLFDCASEKLVYPALYIRRSCPNRILKLGSIIRLMGKE